MTIEARAALQQTVLFNRLSEAHLSLLADLTEIREVPRNDFVFREGDDGDAFYIILKGRIRISRQIAGIGEEALAILDAGSWFGEMALVDDQPRSADALAHEHATLLRLGRQDLQDLLFINRDLALEVLWSFVRTLSMRLRETGNKLTFLTVSSKFG
jgi:CRP-like cAMP-binding protein